MDAAGAKFNFLKFKLGLVPGHCISVDPYYLSHKAIQLGYHPEVFLSGRRVNDRIASFIASKTVKLMIAKDHHIKDANVLIMGITFKEDCPDVRNTKVADIYHHLEEYDVNVDVYDPWANAEEVRHQYLIDIIDKPVNGKKYNAIIVAVAHKEFLTCDLKAMMAENAVVFDAKGIVDRDMVDSRL